ncbi:MAG TPA: hypothetical protein VEF33_10350 [Syntrophales bacterium]|nr:hypothetical protein [Syntrophales bacterium]
METVRDLVTPYLKDDHIVSAKIVAPAELDDPAIVRVIVEFDTKHRQTMILRCVYTEDDNALKE